MLCAALTPAPVAVTPDAQEPQTPTEVQAEVVTPAPEQPAQAIAAPTELKLPMLSGVRLLVIDEISSKTAVTGDPVKLRLARPLYVGPQLGLPAGTPVEGVVIHAAKGGMGGKSGELLVGAKAIVLSDSVRVPLRSFKLAPARGKNNEGVAMGAAVAGGAVGAVASMFIVGGSARIPAGIEATAKTSADATIPVALLSPLPPIEAVVTTRAPAAPALATQANPTQGESK